MTRVALLWHMHQPYYEDLVTREHILPWVRLHALKDYYGMVALLEEFPGVRVTFNLVPSLLVQLEAFAEGRAHDRYLEVGMKPADMLSGDDIDFMLRNFFHAQRQRMIETYPRYADLLSRRGPVLTASDLDDARRRFGTDDLRDLQVWQKLAWMDPYYLAGDARVRALVTKGQGFSEDDKHVLRQAELELLNAVIPAYRRLAETGQIEISTSPFYHPILPLLCDTDIYKHTHPHSRMPRHRFQRPEDAREQLERAARCHERLFGKRPVGLWPSEGSVSDAMVALAAATGFEWMATDELILANSFGLSFGRSDHGFVDHPSRLYASYRVSIGGSSISCGFRDHALSDLIGFVYSGWDPEQAATDFVGKLDASGRRAEAEGAEDPVIFVILDGENAWEHFEGGGRPFLRALYRRLMDHPSLRTVTMGEACRQPSLEMHSLFPGSWIDSNFYIWIGHADDQRAWSQLAEARAALDAPTTASAAAVARAHEEILIAEGSDWFWWYGDDHSSDHDLEFDDLFRRHLRNVYGLLDKPVPDELFTTNISAGARLAPQVDPTRLLSPTIDGRESSYFEWLGAGSVEIRETAGTMHQTDRHAAALTGIQFGCSREVLFVRIELPRASTSGPSFGLTFVVPEGWRLELARSGVRAVASLLERTDDDRWALRQTGAVAAFGALAEVSIPFADFGAKAGQRVAFFVTVHEASGIELERHPSGRPIELVIPDERFEARLWSA
ncbi:MAG: glycoside hydrolase family 57 protein [Vicinamibacterales bacterium]